jgi:hypothetical protein
LRLLGLLIATLAVVQPARGDDVIFSAAELVDLADVIFVGTINRKAAAQVGGGIYTYHSLSIAEVLRGRIPGSPFVFRVVGGRIGNTAVTATHRSPRLERGETYLLFAQASDDAGITVIGGQGTFLFRIHPRTGGWIVTGAGDRWMARIDGEDFVSTPITDAPSHRKHEHPAAAGASAAAFVAELRALIADRERDPGSRQPLPVGSLTWPDAAAAEVPD